MTARKTLTINIHDSHLGIWQDDARDSSFRSDIYAPLIRNMRSRGWSIKRDRKVHQHYRSISQDHRLGARGSLRCVIEITGRVVKVEFWSTLSPQDNRNGRRYDFDKLGRMPYMDRLRVELEFKRIMRWLETLAPVTVKRQSERHLTPIQRIEKGYAESCNTDKALGRPKCDYDSNRRSHDGALLTQGQTVWLADRKGRITRGVTYYNLNSMWWVIAGGQLFNESCDSLHVTPPTDLRIKQNERTRRNSLEKELAIAVQRMHFQRAEVLKRVLFGKDETFLIWARDKGAYYRSQYSGYTSDRITAGKYTRAEAEAECRRVPHELEMVCPDGTHVRFERKVA
ncbi:hypothetical protein ACRQ5Q_14415 [Bradyrhizobium sp. PMVTL-01]|uniref:hypothetical protein n=1 Tax=Bradyrhizobium sp. PMVTL-01 TaxID=3434999 RepID=UPI003F6EEE05